MTTDEQVSALQTTAAQMHAAAPLYRIVTIIGQQRQYACTDAAGALLGFTCKPDRAVKLPVEKALRMLRQVRRRMALNADMEAAP